MSFLNSLINHFPLERGIEFNETPSTTPTRTGTNPLGDYQITNNISFDTNGPTSHGGSWKFTRNSSATNFRTTGGSEDNESLGMEDGDFSLGFWFKTSALPAGTSTTAINILLAGPVGNGAQISVVGSENTIEPSRFRFRTLAGTGYPEDPVLANKWYYIAYLSTATESRVYLNGEKVLEFSGRVAFGPVTSFLFGNTSQSTDNIEWNISNFYLTTPSDIGESEIQRIWRAGSNSVSGEINSKNVELAIDFDQPYSLSPFITGSKSPTTQPFLTKFGPDPVYVPGEGPRSGGSWGAPVFVDTPSIIFSGNVDQMMWRDSDYAIGFWFKMTDRPVFTFNRIVGVSPTGALTGFNFEVRNPGLGLPIQFSATFGSNQRQDLGLEAIVGRWYFVLIRQRVGTNASQIWIDGQLISQNSAFLGNSNAEIQIDFFRNILLSNFFVAEHSQIGPQQIEDIYNSQFIGGSVASADVMTASGQMVDPEIGFDNVITVGVMTGSGVLVPPTAISNVFSNVFITTVFLASSEFGQNVNVFAAVNNNFVVTETMNAFAEKSLVASVNTTSDFSFAVQAMEASAVFVKPFSLVFPMTATAEMKSPTTSISVSYAGLVLQANPWLYVGNGAAPGNIVRYGSQTLGSFTANKLTFNVTPVPPLSLVNEGRSWRTSNQVADGRETFLHYLAPNAAESFDRVASSTFNYTYEFWSKSILPPSDTQRILFSSGRSTDVGVLGKITVNHLGEIRASVNRGAGGLWSVVSPNNTYIPNQWNYIVFTGEVVGATLRLRLWNNGQPVASSNLSTFQTFTRDEGRTPLDLTWGGKTGRTADGTWGNASLADDGSNSEFDEMAVYTRALTNTEIVQRYDFVANLSPDTVVGHQAFTASALMPTAFGFVQNDTTFVASSATASADLVDPEVLASVNVSNAAEVWVALGLMKDPGFVGVPDAIIQSAPFIGFAEMGEALYVNQTYFDYVMQNIQPYRFVTYDNQNPLEDFGSDATFAVPSNTFVGELVGRQFGINNKSVESSGLDYTNDGAIFFESDSTDDWGTSNGNYHFGFWMQRSVNDQSINGLKVLANLNSHKEDDHLVLYEYQNKLFLTIVRNSNSFEFSANIGTLFDFERHFILVKFRKQGNKNFAEVYVDGVLKISEDLDNVKLITTNDTAFAPNNPENNKPRLAIGSLITPFEDTILPVIPTNTRMYIDEVHWAKTAITAQQVLDLFNAMPEKTNTVNLFESAEASGLMVDPEISFDFDNIVMPMTAFSEFADPSFEAQRNLSIEVSPFEAFGEMTIAKASEIVGISAEPMLAFSVMTETIFFSAIGTTPMTASAELVSNNIRVQGQRIADVLPPWARYLRRGVRPISPVQTQDQSIPFENERIIMSRRGIK